MSDPLSDKQEAAEGALSLAMMRLGAEPPCDVYDERGYVIWIKAVAAEITRFHRAEIERLRTALRAAEDARKEVRGERDLFRTEWESVSEVAHEQQTTVVTLRHRLATAESSLTRYKEQLATTRPNGSIRPAWNGTSAPTKTPTNALIAAKSWLPLRNQILSQ